MVKIGEMFRMHGIELLDEENNDPDQLRKITCPNWEGNTTGPDDGKLLKTMSSVLLPTSPLYCRFSPTRKEAHLLYVVLF